MLSRSAKSVKQSTKYSEFKDCRVMCAVPLRSSDRLQLSSSPESILAQQTHPIFARFSLTWTCSKTYLKSPSCEAQHVLLARTLASVAFVFWSCSRGPSQESHPGLSDPPRLYHQQPELSSLNLSLRQTSTPSEAFHAKPSDHLQLPVLQVRRFRVPLCRPAALYCLLSQTNFPQVFEGVVHHPLVRVTQIPEDLPAQSKCKTWQ